MPTRAPEASPAVAAALLGTARRLASAQRVWLSTHSDPDGDAIGSLLGLGWLLAEQGIAVTRACQDPPPSDVRFLPGAEAIVATGPAGHDLAIALDAGDFGRLGRLVDEATWSSMDTIVIDHHATNPGFGKLNVLDPAAAATAEMIVALADAAGWPLGVPAATCLLTGIITDTIGFRTSNTTAHSVATAARLISAGAPLAEITQMVFYRRPLVGLRLAGRALERLEVRGRVGLTTLRRADFVDCGAPPAEARGISSLLASAAELDAVVVMHEREDGTVDVSMRSKPGVSIMEAATALGGGGHPQAAGARLALPLPEAVALVWSTVSSLVGVGRSPEA